MNSTHDFPLIHIVSLYYLVLLRPPKLFFQKFFGSKNRKCSRTARSSQLPRDQLAYHATTAHAYATLHLAFRAPSRHHGTRDDEEPGHPSSRRLAQVAGHWPGEASKSRAPSTDERHRPSTPAEQGRAKPMKRASGLPWRCVKPRGRRRVACAPCARLGGGTAAATSYSRRRRCRSRPGRGVAVVRAKSSGLVTVGRRVTFFRHWWWWPGQAGVATNQGFFFLYRKG
jgi:hypothetical protein